VQLRVIDRITGHIVQVYEGHNQATNPMLTGIAHYLEGNGILNQGDITLNRYIPRYISLGTMGLINQDQEQATDEDGQPVIDDEGNPVYNGLPSGIGTPDTAVQLDGESDEEFEIRRFTAYMQQTPSYGSDGYATYTDGDINVAENNGRIYLGLGPVYANRPDMSKTIDCELISSFPRAKVSYRTVVPESKSEKPKTIDVIFNAMISTGALAQFREPSKDYIYITEAGLWGDATWCSNNNGLLAGYRIAPPNENNWDMSIKENRDILKSQIIRVGINQVVQVMWKIQIGSIGQLSSRVYDTSIYIGKDGVS
jgi:hypothetical protein